MCNELDQSRAGLSQSSVTAFRPHSLDLENALSKGATRVAAKEDFYLARCISL